MEATCCPECRCSISYGAGTYERKLDQVILDMVHEIDDKSSVQKAEWLARHKKYRARLNGDKMSRLVFEKGVNFAVAVLSVLSLVLITALITTRASMSK